MQEEAYNIADETKVKEKLKRNQKDRDREIDDIKFVLSTEAGRRFYWRHLSQCGVFQSSFTGNSTTFFKEGARSVGLRLLSDLNEARPEAYLEMLKENK